MKDFATLVVLLVATIILSGCGKAVDDNGEEPSGEQQSSAKQATPSAENESPKTPTNEVTPPEADTPDHIPAPEETTNAVPGMPLIELSGEFVCPLGMLVNVEFPKEVALQSLGSTTIKLTDGGLQGESTVENDEHAASSEDRPIWLVFRADGSTGTGVGVNENLYSVKVGDASFKCLGADITEKDAAVTAYNMILSHNANRGYRRLLFRIPTKAKTITIEFSPKNSEGVSVTTRLPPPPQSS